MVHLIHRDAAIVGGDNVIVETTTVDKWNYTDVVPLSNPLDTLVLAHNVPYGVTPIGVAAGSLVACRDVLLVTFKHFDEVAAAA